MAKLHELLAVGNNLDQQSKKVVTDLKGTFDKKRHLFEEKITTFRSSEEGVLPVTESQSSIQTTVSKELGWLAGILCRSIDVGHQIDVANTGAKADIVTEEGETIATAVPATSLLQLEKELKDVHDLLNLIPTLDPAKGFAIDENREAGIYRAREVTKTRTKKSARPIVLFPATKEHPAQVQLIQEDVPVGTIQEHEWSALLTPAVKSELIERVEVLTRAVKKARSRANDHEIDVTAHKIGQRLLDYVFKPLD